MRQLLILTLLLLIPAVAAAENSFEITPFIGYRVGGEFSAYDNNLFPFDVEVDDSVSYGATFDIPVVAGLSIELLASHQPSDFVVDRPLFAPPSQGLGAIDLTYYQVGAMYQWLGGQVHPFVSHTLGLVHLAPEFGFSDDKFAMTLGGGVKIFPSEHVGFRFEGRGFWANTSSTDYWDDDYYCCGQRGTDLFQFEASFGLIFAF